MSFVAWYLFWVATVLACATSASTLYGPIFAAISLVFLLLYVWVDKEHNPDVGLMRPFVYTLQIAAMLLSAFVTRNPNFFVIMGPTFLLYYHKEGGPRHA